MTDKQTETVEPARYHFTDEAPFPVTTAEGRAWLGDGWLAITEAEYAALSRLSIDEGVTQADREAAASALGYRDWGDATDYRLSGAQDRSVAAMVQAFRAHRVAALRANPSSNVAEMREALKPFACDDFEHPVADENGWTDFGVSWSRERIVDWFGPSAFRHAAAASSREPIMTQVYHAPTIEAAAPIVTAQCEIAACAAEAGKRDDIAKLFRELGGRIIEAIRALPTTREASEPSPLSERKPRLNTAIITAACEAHFGKGCVNIDGLNLTANSRDWSFREAFKRMWRGAWDEIARQQRAAPGSAAAGGSDALGETVAKLRELLGKAAFQFETYERGHRGKAGTLAMTVGAHHGDTFTAIEKAERNADMAKMCRDAIAGARASTLLTALEQRQGGRLPVIDDDAGFFWRWVERGLYDDQISATDAFKVLAWHPRAPWKIGRWDVDHKPYASKLYADFPKAAAPLPTHPEES